MKGKGNKVARAKDTPRNGTVLSGGDVGSGQKSATVGNLGSSDGKKVADPRFTLPDEEVDESGLGVDGTSSEEDYEDDMSDDGLHTGKEGEEGGEGEEGEEDDEEGGEESGLEGESDGGSDGEEASSDEEDGEGNDLNTLTLPPLDSAKPLTAKSLSKFQSKIDASGVVYFSRIPPFMKPEKLRQLLTPYGKIGRIYLVPEDPKIAARRKKYRHNRRQNFVEGWVEFLDKRVGRSVAEMLNGKQIGGKKRSFYYDDIWTMKYLPRFKWNHLTEQIAYELKVREQRLKAEMAQAKRENKVYVKNVDKAKMIEGMEEKKREKKRKAENETEAGGSAAGSTGGVGKLGDGEDGTAAIRRRFKQRKVVDADGASKAQPTSGKTAALLNRIFT
ncbi:RNA-binding ATPase activator esf2 [Borealophlyctis nickersoniae]|nr:RNA-binding ATPase activator esf2 [Borealophlyctis nickersoniae]